MNTTKRILLGSMLATLAMGCGDDTSGTSTSATTTVPEVTIKSFLEGMDEVVAGIANIDDDNSNGKEDWKDGGDVAGENDLVAFTFPADILAMLGEGEIIRATLVGGQSVRAWATSGDLMLEGASGLTTLEWMKGDGEQTLHIEHDYFLSEAKLKLEHVGIGGGVFTRRNLRLVAGPLILNNHLMPSEDTWVMKVTSWGGNTQMIDSFSSVLGNRFHEISQNAYGSDVWVQDEIEFATSTAPNGHRVDVVIDSIRDRGLDPFPENELEGPDMAVMVWGSGYASSQDSGGNLEITPPFTDADGTEYPFGRIYYGEWVYGNSTYTIHNDLTTFMEEQKVQTPFTLDTSFLCVGHVDEFMTFVPDSTAPRGFRLIMSDVDMAYEILDAADPSISLSRYNSGHGFSDVGEMVDDNALRQLNNEIQEDYIDTTVATLRSTMNLSDEEIVLIPALFETVSGCYNTNAALIPGTANLIVGHDADGALELFIPDPFMRSNESDYASDLMIPAFEAAFPAEANLNWIDDWDVYHMGLGEVHCGTNVTRTPTTNWWTEALHFLD